jgi:NADPH2:quinone reductase
VHAVSVSRVGGPEVLEYVELPDPEPGEGQVLVAVQGAGVNFIDCYRRSGLYPVPLPSVPGSEVAGRVLAVGPGVGDVAVGDLVAAKDVVGGYADLAVIDASRTVPVPDGVDAERAAAALLQGLTAQYLVTDTYPLRAGDRCLIHAAAGGVGLLLVQWAAHLGAEVFATVGSPEKADLAAAAGAEHVLVRSQQDVAAAVQRIAGPRPLDVVYDGLGKETFAEGLSLLRPRGLMVTFGNASGPVDPVAPLELMRRGSLFLTRPTLDDYTATTTELRERAADLLARVAAGTLDVRVGARFPLSRAADAHRLIESGTSTGKILLLPDRTD